MSKTYVDDLYYRLVIKSQALELTMLILSGKQNRPSCLENLMDHSSKPIHIIKDFKY